MIVLPLPPTINHYYHRNAGRVVLTKKARNYRRDVAWLTTKHERFGEARLAVTITLNPPRNSDIDNRIKPLLDALEHAGLFDNDRQVDELFVRRCAEVDRHNCLVSIGRL